MPSASGSYCNARASLSGASNAAASYEKLHCVGLDIVMSASVRPDSRTFPASSFSPSSQFVRSENIFLIVPSYNLFSMTIKAVLFDYGMVLSGPPDPAARARMEQILDATSEAFSAAYWQPRDAYDRGLLTGAEYWHAVAAALHKTITPEQLTALLAADGALWTQPNQEMIDWAAALQRAGIRTGILSNLGDEMELAIRAKFPWLAGFHHHTFSHHLKIAKPDPAIYAHAAEGLGVAAAEILFLDDREENIAAARNAGMLALQYSTHEAFVRDMQALGLGSLLTP